MEYCPHCMQPSGGAVCSHCGGEMNWTAAPGQLPLSTMLRGSENHTYLIGAARGQGGFGITYAALDLNDNQRVAIKEYYPSRCALRTPLNKVIPMTGQDSAYRSGLKSFLEEAMMLSAVGALPSVVTVKDYFEANGTAYLVMEFVDGVPLHEIVNKRGKIPASELLPKLDPLLQDLAILHKARVIHRDISPDNLMLMPDGSLKLLDFGSARSVQDGKAMTVLLKAGFSPVEQYQSRGQGPWTDVYALAGTIYYCLTGVIPPTAVDRLDSDTLQSPNSLGANLPRHQEKALLWGLTVQPKARPGDMEQFRQQLFARSGPVRVEVPGRIKPPAHKETVLLKDLEKKPAPRDTDSTAEKTVIDTSTHREEQTNREEVPPEKPPKKKNTALIVIAAVAAFVVTSLVILMIIGFSGEDTPTAMASTKPTESIPATTEPTKPTEPAPTQTEPTPTQTEPTETEPTIITGETEDGYLYSIDKNSGICTITGYTGNESNLLLPEKIEGYTATVIGERAFYENRQVDSLIITENYTQIGDEAFYGSVVEDLFVLGNFTVGDSAFARCDELRCVVNAYGRTLGLSRHLPEDCKIYDFEMDVGDGTLQYVVVDNDGVIYAVTSENTAVVMDIPDDTTNCELASVLGDYQVTWIYEGAVEGVSTSAVITLPSEALFPYELWDDVDWRSATASEKSACWWLTCCMCSAINKERESGAAQIFPDEELLECTMTRALELSQDDSFTRPNGDRWSTVLNEVSFEWDYASTANYSVDSVEKLTDVMLDIASEYVDADPDNDNIYYTRVAMGIYRDTGTNKLYVNAIVTDG